MHRHRLLNRRKNNNNTMTPDEEEASLTEPLSTTTRTVLSPLLSDENAIEDANSGSTTCSISSNSCSRHQQGNNTMLWGRITLFSLAFVYGSLNISMRLVYARPDPPTASASSAIQGWLTVLCFLPLLKWQQQQGSTASSSSPAIDSNNKKEKQVSILSYHLPITTTTMEKNTSSSRNTVDRSKIERTQRNKLWRLALELAVFNFATQALINISLVLTPGARASFLVQMSVVLTPIVSVVLFRTTSNKHIWIACLVAVTGLFVLSYSPPSPSLLSSPHTSINNPNEVIMNATNHNNSDDYYTSYYRYSSSFSLSWGDYCCLTAALCWSYYICKVSASGRHFDETKLQFTKNIILAVLYTVWMAISCLHQPKYGITAASTKADDKIHNGTSDTDTDYDGTSIVSQLLWKGWKKDPIGWIILFYTALFPCTIADIYQQKAQAVVPAAETNVILSLEPVFTTILGLLLLGESPSLQELLGGALIVVASLLASCYGTSQ